MLFGEIEIDSVTIEDPSFASLFQDDIFFLSFGRLFSIRTFKG